MLSCAQLKDCLQVDQGLNFNRNFKGTSRSALLVYNSSGQLINWERYVCGKIRFEVYFCNTFFTIKRQHLSKCYNVKRLFCYKNIEQCHMTTRILLGKEKKDVPYLTLGRPFTTKFGQSQPKYL